MKAGVLLSGGQDSATCAFWAVHEFGVGEVCALSFDYGQRHARELQAAGELCTELGLPHRTFQVPAGILRSALTDPSQPIALTGSTHAPHLPTTFVPGRNLLFLTLAMSFVASRGGHALVTGVSAVDFSGYPDCRRDTMDALQQACRLGLDDPQFTIHTPLVSLSKAQTWELARRVGGEPAVDFIRRRTLTCYRGDESPNDWGMGCGSCPACELRSRGWEEFQALQA